ncbi:MAG: indolepyruvate oxidoreductase subunit beta family protein [Betaproteobacteria bacterium]|nr:MAG: indolepyruvate oxidoreductase subunit beta family protein [Betaproteobacteria bacterium]
MDSATGNNVQRPVSLLICALGGEGGGVLVEWLVRTATACGFAAQSTSIPGVAQRTGSTTYYLEIFPVPLAQLGGRQPVLSLYPVPGALDILVSSELLETVRQIGNGMVSPDRTEVLTSTSRTLTTLEKMQLADGRASDQELLGIVDTYSRAHRAFDMSAVARDAGTVVSAVLMGAIAGSELLPFPRQAFEATIRQSGRGVDASLKGFARAFELVQKASIEHASPERRTDSSRTSADDAAVPQAISTVFSPALHDMVMLGYSRLVEYQDEAYAQLYLDRVARIQAAEQAANAPDEQGFVVTRDVARYLALWMAFDDIVRVADLKSRASRFARIRSEVKAAPDELLRVYDFFKPGVPELAGLLPESIAQFLMKRDKRRRDAGKVPLALPIKVAAHSVFGYVTLRLLAKLRWLRKRSLRYKQEQRMIERWLDGVTGGLESDWQVGIEVAQCGRLIKGYGSTNERGKENLLHVLDHLLVVAFDNKDSRAEAIRKAREAALADDTGKALDQTLVELGAPARPVKAQPVVWMKKPRGTAV